MHIRRPARRSLWVMRYRFEAARISPVLVRSSGNCGQILAVLRLMTSSYFVGACTGRSAGFSPLRNDLSLLDRCRLMGVRCLPRAHGLRG
jgi:hypothetical protein